MSENLLPPQTETQTPEVSLEVQSVEPNLLSIQGIKAYFLATRISWNEETLHGTDGTSGSAFDRKTTPGLVEQHETGMKATETQLQKRSLKIIQRDGSMKITSKKESAEEGDVHIRDVKKSALPIDSRGRRISRKRERQINKIREKEWRRIELEGIHGKDRLKTAKQRKEEGLPAPGGSRERRKLEKKGAKEYQRLGKKIESGSKLGVTAGLDRVHRAAVGDTLTGRFRNRRINRIQRRIDSDRDKLREILSPPTNEDDQEEKLNKSSRREVRRAMRQRDRRLKEAGF